MSAVRSEIDDVKSMVPKPTLSHATVLNWEWLGLFFSDSKIYKVYFKQINKLINLECSFLFDQRIWIQG